MRRSVSWLGVSAVGAGLFLLAPGCGDSENSSSSGLGGGGAAGSVGGGGMGAGLSDVTVQGSALVGDSCADDDDCGEGLHCYTAAEQGLSWGGPAGGYCTVECDPRLRDADCQQFGDAYCFEFGQYNPVSVCLLGCEPNSPLTSEKCNDRLVGVVCAPVDGINPPGACYPLCQGDAECGRGLYCDPYSGLCTDGEPEGDPLGSECSVDEVTGDDDCAGFCLPVRADETSTETLVSFCSQPCTVGWGCHWDEPDGPAEGACWPASADAQFGDLGYCIQLCNCNDDCVHRGLVCSELHPDEADYFNQRGACMPPLDGEDEGMPCASGGNGGDGGASGASGGSAAGAPQGGVAGVAGAAGSAGAGAGGEGPAEG